MKNIFKKYWVLIGILIVLMAYTIFQMTLPSITLINESNDSFDITSSQSAVYISDGKLRAGGTPDRYDILKMQEIKGVIRKGESHKIVFDIFNTPTIYDDEFQAFSVDWQDKDNDYFQTVSYEVFDNNKGVCSVIITITDDGYTFDEASKGFCLKSLSRILE